jgi:hypothetical protein
LQAVPRLGEELSSLVRKRQFDEKLKPVEVFEAVAAAWLTWKVGNGVSVYGVSKVMEYKEEGSYIERRSHSYESCNLYKWAEARVSAWAAAVDLEKLQLQPAHSSG